MRRVSVPAESFAYEAERTFGFLVEAHGFAPPRHTGGSAVFVSDQLVVEVSYDARSKYVTTTATALIEGRDVSSELSCLYEHAGLGAPERIGRLAVTAAALSGALLTHAAAVRELLPTLLGPARDRMLLACHGR